MTASRTGTSSTEGRASSGCQHRSDGATSSSGADETDPARGIQLREAELRKLGARTDFADPEDAVRLLRLHEAELAMVNAEVNEKLGEDFQRMFATPAVRHRLGELNVPVLLVHGEADPRPKAAVEALATELPRSRLVILDRVGHFPCWESPATLRNLLRDFLGTVKTTVADATPRHS